MDSRGIGRHSHDVRSGPFHRQDESAGSKGPFLQIPPLDRDQMFFTSFRRLFSLESRAIERHGQDVQSEPFQRQDESNGSKGPYL